MFINNFLGYNNTVIDRCTEKIACLQKKPFSRYQIPQTTLLVFNIYVILTLMLYANIKRLNVNAVLLINLFFFF